MSTSGGMTTIVCSYFSRSGDHRSLHSFPTRRSSDLVCGSTFTLLAHGGVIDCSLTGSVHILGAEPNVGVQLLVNGQLDRKSTRLNSSHVSISYAVLCLKKKDMGNRLFQTTSLPVRRW